MAELCIKLDDETIQKIAEEVSKKINISQPHWIDMNQTNYIPSACRYCSNHPINGGSGICHCTLGTPSIT